MGLEDGFSFRFDPSRTELVFEARIDQRGITDIAVSGFASRARMDSAAMIAPATLSGYVNMTAGLDKNWTAGGADGSAALNFEAQSAFRLWHTVFENDLVYDGTIDTSICPDGATCVFGHAAGLKRRSSRIVYDLPTDNIRLQLGDTVPLTTTGQNAPESLGVSLEHSPRKFAPGQNISARGSSSFRLERAARIDVKMNGVILQTLRLGPGNYNLTDLPLQTGANNIDLEIEDDTGDKRTLSFSSFHDDALLAPGQSEWAISGGLPSYLRDNQRLYREQDWTATGFLRYGVTDRLTAEFHSTADGYVQMAGANALTALPLGFVGLYGAISQSSSGTGYSATASYDLNNVEGVFHGLTGRRIRGRCHRHRAARSNL